MVLGTGGGVVAKDTRLEETTAVFVLFVVPVFCGEGVSHNLHMRA